MNLAINSGKVDEASTAKSITSYSLSLLISLCNRLGDIRMSIEGVFGKPVKHGSRTERALEAFKNENVDGKHDRALDYVNGLNKRDGSFITTRGIFYNATGETMNFEDHHSFDGHFEGTYPYTVENGQWGTFFHTKKCWLPSGSSGYKLYNINVNGTKDGKLLIAWSAPFNEAKYDNQAYCEIFDKDHPFTSIDVVQTMMNDKNTRECHATKGGIRVQATITMGHNPLFEAKFFRDNVEASQST